MKELGWQSISKNDSKRGPSRSHDLGEWGRMRLLKRLLGRKLVSIFVCLASLTCSILLYSAKSAAQPDAAVQGHKAPGELRRDSPDLPFICNEKHAGGIGLRETGLLKRMQTELTSAWNHSDRPTKIAVLGTRDYIFRDLPLYQEAFENRTFQIVHGSGDGKLNDDIDYDSLLCLAYDSESCLEKDDFERIPRGKKVNRIRSLREVLSSKHTFCETLTASTTSFQASDFFIPCWVMPNQYDKLYEDSARLHIKRWIAQPRVPGAGRGISIIDSLRKIKRSSTQLIHQYMSNPHLLKGADGKLHKWEMHTFVLVTSVMPLRAYVYRRGLIRLALSPYSEGCNSQNQTACRTSLCINMKLALAKLGDMTWSFRELEAYLGTKIFADMFSRMQRAIAMTLLAALPAFAREWEMSQGDCSGCYQLLHVDVVFDNELRPKVIAANGEPPNMQVTTGTKTHYDITKKSLIRDLLRLVFQDRPAHLDLSRALHAKAQVCGNDVKLRKADVYYLLETYLEMKGQGDFAPVYPNPQFQPEFRQFLQHMATVQGFSQNVHRKMYMLLNTNNVLTDVLTTAGDEIINVGNISNIRLGSNSELDPNESILADV